MSEDDKLAEAPVDQTVNLEAPKEVPEPEVTEPKPDEPKPDAEKESGDDAAEAEEKKKLSGSERQKRKAARLAGELAEAQRVNQELLERINRSTETQKTGTPGIDREPTEKDFPEDYFAFERAKTAWEVRQAIRQENERSAQSRRQSQQIESRMELVDDYAEALDEVKDRVPDFDQVVSKVNIKIPNELADEILSAGKKGPLISYYLAQNPDKLAQLVNMSGKDLAREVGRIEARVHLPKAKTTTEASPPPAIPKGGAAPAFDPFKSNDMNAYVAWRKKGGGTKAAS